MGEHLSSDRSTSARRTVNGRGQGDRLRADLLAAASDLMAAPRPVQVPSLRAVARAAGVTPSAVYLHFSCGRALAAAVFADLFADLRREIDSTDDPDRGPDVRLRAMAHALAAWAHRRPGAYQVLFEAPDPAGVQDGPGLDLLDRLTHLITVIDHGDGRRSRQVAMRTWAALHGLISLRLHKPHAPWTAGLHDDIDGLLDALVG